MSKEKKKRFPSNVRPPKRGSQFWQSRIVREYSDLDEKTLVQLVNEPFDIIRRVFSKLRFENNIAPSLGRDFPEVAEFDWYAPVLRKKNPLESVLRLSIARLCAYTEEIKSFLDLQMRFSVSIVENKLDKAENILSECKTNFGISSWWIEAKLLLAECIGGMERTRKQLADIFKLDLPTNALVIAEFASLRVDATMPVLEYIRQVQAMVANGRYKIIDPCLPTYLCFVLYVPSIGFSPPSSQEMAFILRSEFSRPIIDCYLSVRRLLWMIAGTGFYDNCEIDTKRALAALSAAEDPSLPFLGRTDHGSTTSASEALLQNAVINDAKNALSQCVELTRQHCTNIALYETLATACIVAGESCPEIFDDSSAGRRIFVLIHDFLSYRENAVHAYWGLVKLESSLMTTTIGHQLTAFVLRGQPLPLSSLRREREIHYSPGQTGKFPTLTNFASYGGNVQYALAEVNVLAILSRGNDELCDGNNEAAFSSFTKVIEAPSADSFSHTEAVRGAVEAMLNMNQINMAVQLLSVSKVEPWLLCFVVPVSRLINAYQNRDTGVDVSLIGWPILFFLGNVFGGTPSRQLHSVYANFLESHGCSKPHELYQLHRDEFEPLQLQMFLHYVCTIDCMESDIAFAGTDEVENERMLILQQLQLLDTESASVFAAEISQLQQQIATRKAIKSVSGSKVYFNTEGIEKRLPKSFYEQFNRYKQYRKLSLESRQVPDSMWGVSDDGSRQMQDGAFILFRHLFYEIRRVALFSNEHGLDSYLSVRIRHQTLKGAIRSVFDQFKLMADMEKGVYKVSEHWSECFGIQDSPRRRQIESAVIAFSRDVDGLIDDVSGKWMRIRENEVHPEGWFDLDFENTELVLMSERLSGVDDEIEFIDDILECIRLRISDALVTVRQNVRSVLGESLSRALDQLSCNLEHHSLGAPTDLVNAITRCRTAVQNELDEITNWFQLQDVLRLEDFPFVTLLNAAIENVRKCFPSSNFACGIEGETSLVICGRFFPLLWDLCFLLFENVVKHSSELSEHTRVNISQDDATLTLVFRNRLAEGQLSEESRAKISAAQVHEPSRIRTEGGSGFSKIMNILQSNLGMGSESFLARINGDSFEAIVKIDINQLTV